MASGVYTSLAFFFGGNVENWIVDVMIGFWVFFILFPVIILILIDHVFGDY